MLARWGMWGMLRVRRTMEGLREGVLVSGCGLMWRPLVVASF